MNPAVFRLLALLGCAVSVPAQAQVAANINVGTGPVFPTRSAVMSGGRWNYSLTPRQPVLAHPMGGSSRGPNYVAAGRNASGLVTVNPTPLVRGQPATPTTLIVPAPMAPPRPVAAPPPPGSRLPTLEQVLAPASPAKRSDAQQEALARRVIGMQLARAAEGSPAAQFDLGVRYMNGDGVPKDFELARKWLTESALNGHSPAARKLAELDAQSR